MSTTTIHTIAAQALKNAGLRGQGLEPVGIGKSRANLLRGNDVVLKLVAPNERVDRAELVAEKRALVWLAGRIRVPAIVWSGEIEGWTVLVTERLHGTHVFDLPANDREACLCEIVHAIAHLHRLPANECPLDQSVERKIAWARARVEEGTVDETDFDDRHHGLSAETLFEKMLSARPETESAVVTHGDACLPNFLRLSNGDMALLDLGRMGVSDPYQDFALFLRSTAYNFDNLDARQLLMREYPRSALDEERLSFFRTLDEFF